MYRTVGAEEHDDFESRTRGIEHYNRVEIPTRSGYLVVIGVRANIHLGGQTYFCPNGFSGGGGVVAEIFRDPYSVGGGGGVVAEIFRDPYSVGGGG